MGRIAHRIYNVYGPDSADIDCQRGSCTPFGDPRALLLGGRYEDGPERPVLHGAA